MSVNVYNPQTGLLSAVASSNRVWTGTKAQFEAAQQAGALPLNSVLFITDDEEDYPIGNTDISEIGDGTITGAIAYLSQNGGGGMPTLNFATPVKTFGASDSYTAQDGDYLFVGGLFTNNNNQFTEVKIDDTIFRKTMTASNASFVNTSGGGLQKLASGQVITTDASFSPSSSAVYILREL